MLRDLVMRNRSYRRFDHKIKIEEKQIRSWIDLARMSASGRNNQPLKYRIVTEPDMCDQIFPMLSWAGYLENWKGPSDDEQPVAYIIVIKDHSISENHYCDDGIAIQSILLGAVEDSFGGCIIGSVNKRNAAKLLKLDDKYEILWVVALGKPAEKVVLETAESDIKYWRDEKDVHHVPKRPLEEIILK